MLNAELLLGYHFGRERVSLGVRVSKTGILR